MSTATIEQVTDEQVEMAERLAWDAMLTVVDQCKGNRLVPEPIRKSAQDANELLDEWVRLRNARERQICQR